MIDCFEMFDTFYIFAIHYSRKQNAIDFEK